MIYIVDTDKIKAEAFEKIAAVKRGEYKGATVKEIIRATELMVEIVEEHGKAPFLEEIEEEA